jgi:hypothetical protein
VRSEKWEIIGKIGGGGKEKGKRRKGEGRGNRRGEEGE